ncbi:DUF2510 domain-containing protein [Mycolicibacterium peregrinum]|uniref:DUF2510 domain-containing protein n=1 Tax=Mycolicibacterium peregrinum TaxID=43304 RepID=A0A4Z0HS10_MYCPR|nr:DUF2510 domain-containing protein [Mycolicibacterium peregrinum]MCV7205793.1 DUF2510 domain-containing protein [Mycolicibacterium peregrinum]TGB43158.1 DUF2510 domain-containing protein [Mycolicibacterium peregrinum]TGB44071.1 DUF2510 domain-containing protein [Mycolicibacterium peregrinum]
MTAAMPPGWYDDPDGSPGSERRWDGQNWTSERRRKTTNVPPYAPPPAQMSYPPLPQEQPQYAQPVGQPQYPQHYPPPLPGQYGTVASPSNLFSIIAFVCAGVSVLFCPILFGPAGLILGAVGLTKKERFAPIAIAASAGCMIAGMVLGVAVWSS